MSQLLVERKHSRTNFFKYMSASTAEIVLTNRTLRWSSPILFNDPFDVPRKLAINVGPNDIRDSLLKRHIHLIKNPPSDLSDVEEKLRLIVETVKSENSERLTSEVVETIEQSMHAEPINSFGLDVLRDHWEKSIHDMRILCLCESQTKTPMWYHYADEYTGVVLEFLCNDESDSSWRIAEPIQYIEDDPLVSTAEGWAKLLTMPREKAVALLFKVCMYEKSEDWAYEREWRVASFKRPSDEGDYSDYKFGANEIGGLYLGPLVSSKHKQTLIVAARKYPNVEIYDSKIGPNRKLEFNQIK